MLAQLTRSVFVANGLHAVKSIRYRNNCVRNMHLLLNKAFVNGEWVAAKSQQKFDVLNPANGSIVGQVPDLDASDVGEAIDAAHTAFYSAEWSALTAKERSTLLKKWLALLESHRMEIASIMTAESGKPLSESLGEIAYGNSFIEWFAEEARRIYGEIIPSPQSQKRLLVTRQPIGVAALITPWNFPHAMITRKASAALAAGCTVVIKPAEDTPLTALAIAKLADEAGFPKGVINVVTCSRANVPAVGDTLCKSKQIAGVSFTGSTEVGRVLYRSCADGIKKLGLELGGNAPFIVFESANLKKAVAGAMVSKFRNCGQACVASNRFLVQAPVFDAFVEQLTANVKGLVIGNGKDDGVQLGPIINVAQLHKVQRIVEDARSKGAQIVVGGSQLRDKGDLFYEPTIIAGVTANMLIYTEEIFGPVIPIIKFQDEAEALRIANSCDRGLAGYFYSENLNQVFRVAQKLEVGMVGVNEGLVSTAEAPFGGVKESGIGREGSSHGIDELQDFDNGYFENFGSRLQRKIQDVEQNIAAPAFDAASKQVTDSPSLRTIEEGENDSGTETLHDTDSEPDDQQSKQEDLIEEFTGLNTEELYEEILYKILHNVGCEAENETCQNALFGYVQDAFKIPNGRHEELMSAAKMKKAPELCLNVEVVEAKELEPKDPNGLSDPFVMMYIGTAPSHKYHTSVKSCTLNPSWEEHFSLPLLNGLADESLVVEVWDYDAAETVGEKVSKISEVKGVKGLRKLMKEIVVTASTGKHDNEFIGKCSISLRTIPTCGLTMWFTLDRKNKSKHQGLIKLRLSFSAEKNSQVALQEHKHLLRILLMHELETSKVAPYWWCGKYSEQGEAVIAQHSAQSGITQNRRALAQWSAYTTIHANHALAFKLFEMLLERLQKFLNGPEVTADDVKQFWDGVKKLLPSCFSIIRNIRKKTASDKNAIKVLTEVLAILSTIAAMDVPDDFDLFPKNVYGWLANRPNIDLKTVGIHGVAEEAIRSGAQDYLFQVNDVTRVSSDKSEENLQNIIKVITLIRADLQRGIEHYDKLFKEKLQCKYSAIRYFYYEEHLSESFQMIIENACKQLKRIHSPDHDLDHLINEELEMGTTLFEVYLMLQPFVALGTELCPEVSAFKFTEYHEWFVGSVAHWLEISVYKALKRIEKAIELDKLLPIDENVQHSSSAIDTLAIFYQIKIFWQQLNWPDIENSYTFVAKIVDDICRCCVCYADKMSARVQGFGNVQTIYESKFEVTPEWCLAINDIDYIRRRLEPFFQEWQIDELIGQLAEFRTPQEAKRCEETLKTVISNAVDTVENQILQLIDVVTRKMGPSMRKFLVEGAEVLHQDSNSLDRLMMYLEDSLTTLNTVLCTNNFERILCAIWKELATILYDLVQSNLDKRRPPQFFANLRECLHIMIETFKCGTAPTDCAEKEMLDSVEQKLQLYGTETADLIHQYYLERLKRQQTMPDTPLGQLTVRCAVASDDFLEVEILNARNLVPIASNGSCDPFVRVGFCPEEKFTTNTKYKTNVQNKTLFPLFDEKFVIPMGADVKSAADALIVFTVKDRDLFGISNQYLAECFITMAEINGADRAEQKDLTLNRPHSTDSEIIRALEYRQGDKLAKEFLKKLKQKLPSA